MAFNRGSLDIFNWWEKALLLTIRFLLDLPHYCGLHRLHGWIVDRAYSRHLKTRGGLK